jgi:hypothetical protein
MGVVTGSVPVIARGSGLDSLGVRSGRFSTAPIKTCYEIVF